MRSKQRLVFVIVFLQGAPAGCHVPSYQQCDQNCCSPSRHYDTSQVVYLKGSGGLEVHIEDVYGKDDLSPPEDTAFDFDVVFRDELDATTFSVYVGCGGCMPNDPLQTAPVPFVGEYQPGVLEPFTQTRYYSLFDDDSKVATMASVAACTNATDAHWSIRLVDYGNRTNGKPVVWGAVLGLGETFTARDIIEFPLYILLNHGSEWTDLGWTAPLSFLLLGPVLFALVWSAWERRASRPWSRMISLTASDARPWEARSASPHELLYVSSGVAFTAAAIEELIHLFYSQASVPLDYAFLIGLYLVILLPNGGMFTFACWRWRSLRHKYNEASKSKGRSADMKASAPPAGTAWVKVAWGIAHLLFSVASFFFLGAGFFVGPAALTLASLVHLLQLCSSRVQEWCAPRAFEADGVSVSTVYAPVAAALRPAPSVPLILLSPAWHGTTSPGAI